MGGVATKSHPRRFVAEFTLGLPLLGLLATAPLYWWFWGFTVDDAWIVSRIAQRGLETGEFSFNSHQPTDAVTPLGFAQLVGAVAAALSIGPFVAARWLGVASMVGSVVVAGAALARRSRHAPHPWSTIVWLISLATCVPAAAWTGAGLATPVAALLVTFGFVGLVPATISVAPRGTDCPAPHRIVFSALSLGAASAWRPELLPFALATVCLVPASGRPPSGRSSGRRAFASIIRLALLVLAFPLLVAVFRLLLFGDMLPLSARAKEPSLSHGLRYALGAAALAGPFWLVWLRIGSLRDWRLAAPFVVHLAAMAFAGGDWMPFFRLAAPVVPAMIFAGALGAERSRRTYIALALATATAAAMTVHLGPAARATLQRRSDLVARARKDLKPFGRVAAVDIGWLGRATAADVVDLGGVTNPRIAALPGGHTSHRISPTFLAIQEVDAWVVRVHGPAPRSIASPSEIDPVYVVDQRLLLRLEALEFAPVATFPLSPHRSHYVLFAAGADAVGTETFR